MSFDRPTLPQEKVRLSGAFSKYDGLRIAILFKNDDDIVPVRGIARYELDPTLGSVLRVQPTDDAQDVNCKLLITEADWDGQILQDLQYGCRFCFLPSRYWPNSFGNSTDEEL